MRYLALTLLAAAVGCSESSRDLTGANDHTARATIATGTSSPWGGLKIQSTGASLKDATQIVVLLHGYGATESDLVPLAEYIGGESRAFVFPAGPISVAGGGLAWATTEHELVISHERLASLIRFVSQTYPNAEIAVGGFSQGATVSSMLLTDATLPVRHLVLYSPGLAINASSIDSTHKVQVLLAHGQRDEVLPFADSKRLHEILERKGNHTTWFPFDAGHTITTELLDATRKQLSNDRGPKMGKVW
ncbi:MAG: esterase [Pirellulaceae bacterium]|nr:esterase [Pirellulaceae bacterium]